MTFREWLFKHYFAVWIFANACLSIILRYRFSPIKEMNCFRTIVKCKVIRSKIKRIVNDTTVPLLRLLWVFFSAVSAHSCVCFLRKPASKRIMGTYFESNRFRWKNVNRYKFLWLQIFANDQIRKILRHKILRTTYSL